MAFTHSVLHPALMDSVLQLGSRYIWVLFTASVCVTYGFMVNNSLMLFLLSDWFVTPSTDGTALFML